MAHQTTSFVDTHLHVKSHTEGRAHFAKKAKLQRRVHGRHSRGGGSQEWQPSVLRFNLGFGLRTVRTVHPAVALRSLAQQPPPL